MFVTLFARELRVLLRNRGAVLNPMAFMFLAVMLFAVGSPLTDNSRAQSGGAILWIIVLLTNMLSLDSLFRRDYDNGVLEQVISTAAVPFIVILTRMLVQWIGTGLLITLLAPLLCLFLGLPNQAIPITMLALLLGTPALSLLGAVGAAITVGFSRGGILLGLLVLPMFLPVLIFGASAISQAVAGEGGSAPLYWLAFISMLALTIGPFATTAGLRISLQMQ
jgi:heme exporter protein B